MLEYYHCSKAFEILLKKELNFLENMSKSDFMLFRKYVVHGILNTDMMKHKEMMNDIQPKVDSKKFTPQEGKLSIDEKRTHLETFCFSLDCWCILLIYTP